jgi:hypothetical protein
MDWLKLLHLINSCTKATRALRLVYVQVVLTWKPATLIHFRTLAGLHMLDLWMVSMSRIQNIWALVRSEAKLGKSMSGTLLSGFNRNIDALGVKALVFHVNTAQSIVWNILIGYIEGRDLK